MAGRTSDMELLDREINSNEKLEPYRDWYRVELYPSNSIIRYAGAFMMREEEITLMRKWVAKNLAGPCLTFFFVNSEGPHAYGQTFWFKLKDDAIAFKLRWIGVAS